MPNLLSRSKHIEFEWNLAFQIRNQKERWNRRRVENEVEKWGAEHWAVSFPAAFLFFHFLCFPFIFLAGKHSLRMTTQGMIS